MKACLMLTIHRFTPPAATTQPVADANTYGCSLSEPSGTQQVVSGQVATDPATTPSTLVKPRGGSKRSRDTKQNVAADPATALHTPQKRQRSSKVKELMPLEDCPGVPEMLLDKPLRLIIVGHNPSEQAW